VILADELEQRRFAQSFQKYRFMMRQDFDIEKVALGIKGDQQIDRDSGKSRHRCQINRFEGVADQLIGGRVLTEQGPYRNIAGFVSDDQRCREIFYHGIARHHAGADL